MADLPTAMARLVAALMSDAPADFVPRAALIEVRDALEELSTDPAAVDHLREQIAQAKAASQVHIKFIPIYLLLALLPADDKGGAHHD
ncbi:hypothetical protein D9M68_310470 [compost metagenome]